MFSNFRIPSPAPPTSLPSSQPASKPPSALPLRRNRAATEPTYGGNTHAPTDYTFSETQTTGSLSRKALQLWRKKNTSEFPSPFAPIQQISGSIENGSFTSVENISIRGHHQLHRSNGTLNSFRQGVPSIAKAGKPDDKDIVYIGDAFGALVEKPSEGDQSSISEKSDEAAQNALKAMLDEIFAGFVTPANEEEIEALKNSRFEAMTRHNIGPEEFKQRLEKMESTDDMVALVSGSFSALGFILGYYLFTAVNPTLQNNLAASALPYAPGGVTGMVDCYLRGLLERMHVGYYTSPNPAALEDVMQDFLAQHGRPLSRKMLLLVGALSPYTLRNLLRSLMAPLAAHFCLTAQADLAIDNFGGLFFSGPLVQHLGNKNDQQDKLRHPAYFFGRTDWESEFEKLGDPGHRRFTRFLKQACRASIQMPNMLLDAGKELFTIESATEISLLMAGFACNSWIKQAAGEAYEGASPEARAFLENSTGTAFLAVLYCSLSFAMAGVKELKAGAGRMMEKLPCLQVESQVPGSSVVRDRMQLNLPERY